MRQASEAAHGCAKALAFLDERASRLGRPRRLLGTSTSGVASIGTPLLAPRMQKPAGARGRDR